MQATLSSLRGRARATAGYQGVARAVRPDETDRRGYCSIYIE